LALDVGEDVVVRRVSAKLDYETYTNERRALYQYQQAAYDSYEKTLTALSSSSLAFSIGFLGFLQASKPKGIAILVAGSKGELYLCWIALFLSLLCLLACFFVNVRAFSVELHILNDALISTTAFDRPNRWTELSIALYFATAGLFVLGLLSLLRFCYQNLLS
jgi:hypothetical protein